jgi:hypothetical protein
MYHMVHGMNAPAVILMSPFLPRPAEKFPRFRDVFVATDELPKGDISVYTRMGGGNRACWDKGEEDCACTACEATKLEHHDLCVARVDDSFDSTYCAFVFNVPDGMRPDYEALLAGNFGAVSDDYWKRIAEMFKGRDKILAFVEDIRARGAKE